LGKNEYKFDKKPDIIKQELKSNLEKPKKKKKDEDLEENKFKIFV
jgi:hypothetical protein